MNEFLITTIIYTSILEYNTYTYYILVISWGLKLVFSQTRYLGTAQSRYSTRYHALSI